MCSAGDLVSIYRDAGAGSDGAIRFWQDGYVLNATIAEYPKPFVAIKDGIVLGYGGIGLADYFVPRVALPELVEALQGGEDIVAVEPPASTLDRAWIDDAYAGDDVGIILERLRTLGRDDIADTISGKSPVFMR